VHGIAKRYRKPGVDYESLVQEGHIGLLKAARTYKPKRGKFSTPATPWIRKRVQQAVKEGCSVRLPEKRLKSASRPAMVLLLHDWMRREEGGMRWRPRRTVIKSGR
jgi:RNA polymerase sigma factor (sigma-70 family)